jgi:long-chain acyl-CoA synthetase
MMQTNQTLLITGATGLVGSDVLVRMLRANPAMRAYALVRDAACSRLLAKLGETANRVIPIKGDLRRRGLGIEYKVRRALVREVTLVVHAAADTSFSRPLVESRLANTEGTRELISLCRAMGKLRQFGFVSTAYVAGRAQGVVVEAANDNVDGWVNSYERSKYEAERLVRESSLDWVIYRPSTIVCDTTDGVISQVNAVHRALRIYNRGLAAMMPGDADDTLDVVTADYVSGAIAKLTGDPRASRKTLHLCAGNGAITLGELLDSAYDTWRTDPAWRRRGVERVMLTDLETYNLFASSVIETGDPRLASILNSLSHFIPQLALPKRFDTRVADGLLGYKAPVVSTYWSAMLAQLLAAKWTLAAREAA